jgi:hypothetical protein
MVKQAMCAVLLQPLLEHRYLMTPLPTKGQFCKLHLFPPVRSPSEVDCNGVADAAASSRAAFIAATPSSIFAELKVSFGEWVHLIGKDGAVKYFEVNGKDSL